MANPLAEGIYPCVVTSASYGEDDKQQITIQVNLTFTDGPNKGRFATYSDQVNTKSALYISRSLKTIGWQGKSLKTLAEDVTAFIASPAAGKTTAEVKHILIKNGKRAGEIWDKVNSLGRGPRALKAPTHGNLADAESALADAMRLDGAADADEAADDRIPF